MLIIDTANLDFNVLDKEQVHYVYNGMDSAITLEIFEKVFPQLKWTHHGEQKDLTPVYNFALGLQAPLMEAMLRGVRVDPGPKNELIYEFEKRYNILDEMLQEFSEAAWGRGLNHDSPTQLKAFFYDFMKIPPVFIYDKGKRRASTNRDALEKIYAYYHARPFVNLILALRDYSKKLSVLRKGVDADGRFRSSYSIGGTKTGRLSSARNAFGTGDNMQNQTDLLREIYISDPGMKLGYVDLRQAESFAIGYLSGDAVYIEACQSSDLHTYVTKLIWPELNFGEDQAENRKIAEQKFYRHFTYRDMSKRGGHGTNYVGSPSTMAKHLKVPVQIMTVFQQKYFNRFRGIPQYHIQISKQVQIEGIIETPLGRRRHFWGRRESDEVLREAVAHCPQSHVGDLLNIALWRLWKHVREIQILAQVHDAILFQYPEHLESTVLKKVLDYMLIPVQINGRVLTIPSEVSVGWNWRKYIDETKAAKNAVTPNIYGVREWTGKTDERQRPRPKAFNLLDRIVPAMDG